MELLYEEGAHGAGLSLFSKGRGDDLSGWRILNVTLDISEQPFLHQFKVGIACMCSCAIPTLEKDTKLSTNLVQDNFELLLEACRSN